MDIPPVPFIPGELRWSNVSFVTIADEADIVTIRARLLLVNTETNEALEGDFGEIRRCGMMQLQHTPGQHPHYVSINKSVEVMCIRRAPITRGGQYLGEAVTYEPTFNEQLRNWVEIICPTSLTNRYYTQGAEPIRAVCDPRVPNILRLEAPFDAYAIHLEAEDSLGPRGRRLQSALAGEVRMCYRMAPQPNGVYIFPADHVPEAQKLVAVKVIKHTLQRTPVSTEEIRPNGPREDPIREIEYMALVQNTPNLEFADHPMGHPNVMHFEHCLANAQNVFMVMPFMNSGDLFEAIFERPADEVARDMNQIQCTEAMAQIMSAVRFMHSLGLCHLDISSENVFLHRFPVGEPLPSYVRRGNTLFVLSDLGQTRVHPRDPVTGQFQLLETPFRLRTAPGKKLYYCPETFLARFPARVCGFRIDMWQLGVLTVVLYGRAVPFTTPTDAAVEAWLNTVRRGQLRNLAVQPPVGYADPMPVSVSISMGHPAVFVLASRMLQTEPAAREFVYDTDPFFIGR